MKNIGRRINIKQSTLFLVWIATRLMVFFRISSMTDVEADIHIYFDYAGKILSGLFPYRDFGLEYPPGALPFFVLPRIFTNDLFTYRQLFVAEMMLVDLLALLMVLWYWRKNGFSEKFVYLAGLTFTALPAMLGLFTYQRYDLAPAVLVLGAVILFVGGRRTPAWILLGIGFAVKLYPLILAPVILLASFKQKKLKNDLLLGVPAAAGAAAVVWLPFMLKAGSKFWVFITYHAERGIQLESLYSIFIVAAHFFGYPAATAVSFGSWNIESAVSPHLARSSFFVMLFLMTIVLVHSWLVVKLPYWTVTDLPRLSVLMVLAFVIGGKVLSPQYLLWVLPLLAIALHEDSPYLKKTWGLFGLAVFGSFLIFPTNYFGLIKLELWPLLLLTVRNLLLVVLFYFLFKNGYASRQSRNTRETYPNNG